MADEGFGRGDAVVLVLTNTYVNRMTQRLTDRGVETEKLDSYEGRPSNRVKVGTFHRAKGLEFKAVFLPLLDRFPSMRKVRSEEEAAEERELALSQLFVAMTRARDVLVILHQGPLDKAIAAATGHFEQLRR